MELSGEWVIEVNLATFWDHERHFRKNVSAFFCISNAYTHKIIASK
jgi:hypothetical protein